IYFVGVNDNSFTIDNVFTPDDATAIHRFLIFSMLITDYAYNCFKNWTEPGFSVMIEKWALTRLAPILHTPTATPATDTQKSEEARRNDKFARTASDMLVDMAIDYISPTLKAFLDVENTCDDVSFFDRAFIDNSESLREGKYGIIKSIIGKIKGERDGFGALSQDAGIEGMTDATIIKQEAESKIAALIMGRPGRAADYRTCVNEIRTFKEMGFLNYYQNKFPEFGRRKGQGRVWDNAISSDPEIEAAAKDYCEKIIRITYETVCELI
ncbi:MAG: hypothetical protein IJL94_03480, partial [Erysipelotrichaceae bacterium]|nr:hypothetical protein [Erysipelotrichaceae bacterium]